MTNEIKLFKGDQPNGGVWTSDLHAYYDKLDDERGIPRPKKLVRGYHRTKEEKDAGNGVIPKGRRTQTAGDKVEAQPKQSHRKTI